MSKLLLKSAMHQNNRSAGTPVPQHAPLAAAAAAAQYTPQLGDMPPACMELVLGHLGEADKRAVLGVSHAMQRAVLCHAASVTLQQVTEGSQHQQSQEGSSTRNSGGAAIEAVTYLSPGGGSMRQLTLVADAGGLQRISCIPALRDGRVKSLVLKAADQRQQLAWPPSCSISGLRDLTLCGDCLDVGLLGQVLSGCPQLSRVTLQRVRQSAAGAAAALGHLLACGSAQLRVVQTQASALVKDVGKGRGKCEDKKEEEEEDDGGGGTGKHECGWLQDKGPPTAILERITHLDTCIPAQDMEGEEEEEEEAEEEEHDTGRDMRLDGGWLSILRSHTASFSRLQRLSLSSAAALPWACVTALTALTHLSVGSVAPPAKEGSLTASAAAAAVPQGLRVVRLLSRKAMAAAAHTCAVALVQAPCVEEVHLEHMKLKDGTLLSALATSPRLRTLSLDRVKINSQEAQQALAALPERAAPTFTDLRLSGMSPAPFAPHTPLLQLVTTLNAWQERDAWLALLHQHAAAFHRLSRLDLQADPRTKRNIHSAQLPFEVLTALTALTTLTCSCVVPPRSVKLGSAAQLPPGLAHLYLTEKASNSLHMVPGISKVPHLHINVLRVPELVAQHASRGRGVWAPGAPRTAAEALGSAATVTPWHPGPPDVGAAGVKFWAADHCVWLQGAFGTPGLMAQDAMAALAPMASHLACVGIIQAGHQELLLTRAIVSALGATLGRHTHTLCLWGCRLDTAPHGFGQAGWVALLGALPALRVLALRWNMQDAPKPDAVAARLAALPAAAQAARNTDGAPCYSRTHRLQLQVEEWSLGGVAAQQLEQEACGCLWVKRVRADDAPWGSNQGV